MENTNYIKIKDLKNNQLFVLKKGKYAIFNKYILLDGKNIPKDHQGKLLLIYDNCKQMICGIDLEVEIVS